MKRGVWPSPRSGRMKIGSTRRIRVVEIDHVASDSLILSPVETGFDKYSHRLTQQ